MIDINELRKLTQAATPGGWYVKRGNHIYGRKEVTDGEESWHPVIACTDDDEVNVSFEANASFIAAANPAVINEILDRLETAESVLKDFGTTAQEVECWLERYKHLEREAEALRAELSKQQALTIAAQHIAEVAQRRANQLQTKIEAMEKQEPVAWRTFDGEGGYDYRDYTDNENYQLGWNARNPNHVGWVEPLYLGAKGEMK